MLHIGDSATELDPQLLRAPGGFLWWYADLVDERGNGLVCIWSFGLPFLPGYASASRRGTPQLPEERPSFNIAVYERGKLVCYLLQEYEPSEVEWASTRWRFGRTSIQRTFEN